MMGIIREEHFRIDRHGDIFVVAPERLPEGVKLGLPLAKAVTNRLQRLIETEGLTKTGWNVLYDFSTLEGIDSAVLMVMARFALWSHANGRRRTAHLLPVRRDTERLELLRQAITGMVAAFGVHGEDSHPVASIEEGMMFLRQPFQ